MERAAFSLASKCVCGSEWGFWVKYELASRVRVNASYKCRHEILCRAIFSSFKLLSLGQAAYY